MATPHHKAFVHTGIQLHRAGTRAESLDEPDKVPVDLFEQYLALRPIWMSEPRRHCADTASSRFFGSSEAVMICDGCPVRLACLEYALDNAIEHGVWGGASESDRRQIRQLRKRTA